MNWYDASPEVVHDFTKVAVAGLAFMVGTLIAKRNAPSWLKYGSLLLTILVLCLAFWLSVRLSSGWMELHADEFVTRLFCLLLLPALAGIATHEWNRRHARKEGATPPGTI